MDSIMSTAAGFRALPDEAPLAMPIQSLRIAPPSSGQPVTEPRLIRTRRVLVIGSAVLMTIEATHEMYRVLAVNGPTVLAIVMLALFVALFAWIALSFTSALAGFFSLLTGGGRRLLAPEFSVPAARPALLVATDNV